jgi:hypothetical protein
MDSANHRLASWLSTSAKDCKVQMSKSRVSSFSLPEHSRNSRGKPQNGWPHGCVSRKQLEFS